MMTTIIIILGVFILYVLPIRGTYLCIQYSYFHEEGDSYGEDIGLDDLFLMMCPVANLVYSIAFLTGYWKDKKYRKGKLNTYFRPKFDINKYSSKPKCLCDLNRNGERVGGRCETHKTDWI